VNCVDVSNCTTHTCIVSDSIMYGFGHINIDTYKATNCYTYDGCHVETSVALCKVSSHELIPYSLVNKANLVHNLFLLY